MMLKMNFNFNFKDIPFVAGPSMCDLTNGCDSHHTEKYGIKRFFAGSTGSHLAHAFTPTCYLGWIPAEANTRSADCSA